MRALAVCLVLLGIDGPSAFGSPVPNLAGTDRVEIWDQRIQDIHSKPRVVTEARVVASVVRVIQGEGGDWKSGSFTSPSGYLRFIFFSGSRTIAGIGMGDGFLVINTPDGWYSKDISAETVNFLNRVKVDATTHKTKANQSTDPTP